MDSGCKIGKMSSPVESAEIRDAIVPMSVDFYHASSELGWIDENTELLQGIPVQKMSKSPEHEFYSSLLLRMIEAILPDGFFVIKERPMTTSDSEPEPDLMVVKGRESEFRENHPSTAAFIIEVSISTLERDRKKAEIYAAAKVEEYWIVDPESRKITVYTEPGSKGYGSVVTTAKKQLLKPRRFPDLSVEIPGLFD